MSEFVRRNWLIAIIVAAFLALGTAYSVVTPIFEAPDEPWHYAVIKHIADGRGLPVQEPDAETPWMQEGCQPPLYYALGALATFWIDTDELDTLVRPSPYGGSGPPDASSENKNRYLHTHQEDFPYRGAALAVHVVRLLSLLMGATTVLATYLIALEVFPERRALAIRAAAFNAFIPQFLFIGGAVSNDNLVTALSSLALLLMVRTLRRGISRRDLVLLGVIIGLALLSKLSALVLLPLSATVLIIAALRRRSLRLFVKWSAVVFLLALAISGWWYIRNWVLYGEPLGMRMLLQIYGFRHSRPATAKLLADLRAATASFWAAFGWGNVLADPIVYNLLNGLALAGVGGLLGLLARQRGKDGLEGSAQLGLLVLALDMALLGIALVRWMQITLAPCGRLLFPAISAISLLLFLGLTQFMPKRPTWIAAGFVGGAMFLLAVVCLFRYLAPAYAKPLLPLDAVRSIPHRLGLDYGGKVELVGYELDREVAKPGESLRLTLYWRSLAEMERDYKVFVHLAQWRADGIVGQMDALLEGTTYPTELWRVGDLVRGTYKVPIPLAVPTSSLYRIRVGVYLPSTMERLPAFDRGGKHIEDNAPVVCQVKCVSDETPKPQTTLYFELGDEIVLSGFDLEGSVKPGGRLRLTLYWQAKGKMEKDYTVFVHLLDKDGHLLAQADSQPQGGNYPTSFWEAEETIEDRYELTIPQDAPPGKLQIEVGMYLLSTMERLPAFDKAGKHMEGDRILLSKVRVEGP